MLTNKILKIFVLIVFIGFFSCNDKKDTPTKEESFTIKGYLQNVSVKKVQLYHNKKMLQTAEVINDTFSFSGKVINPVLYTLQSDSLFLAQLIVENTVSNLFITPNDYIAYGGKNQREINTYRKHISSLESQKLSLIDSFKYHYKTYKNEQFISDLNAIDTKKFAFSIKTLADTPKKSIKQFVFNKLLNSKNSSISQMETLRNNISDNEPVWRRLVNNKIEKLKEVKEEAKQKLNKKKMLTRRLAPVFTGESLQGDLTSADVIKGKKRVLIDFWASWCGPCRQITPQVKYLYQKYHSKGFDIITVSEDKTKEDWKIGIKEDGMTWHHIYDDDMRIAYMFNVLSIPHMILLDERGGIIKDKISLTELERELKNTFSNN